jgi:polysaccharide pyruvyl transferase WcaK-like protein
LSARRARIAFWGNFGTGNWGNECTLQAIVHNARSIAPNAELVCICSEPEDTRRRHGIEAFPINSLRRVGATLPRLQLPKAARLVRRASIEAREWAQTLSVARTVDAMIMTGTGMLTDDSEGAFGLPYDLFKWALAVRACRGHVRFASVGVEAIDTPAARFFILSSLRMADYRSYRDLHSKEQLRKSGFEDARDHIFPDLAFSLPAPATKGGARASGGTSPRVVAVGLYNYKGRGLGSESDARAYRDYLEKLATFVGWLLGRGYRVRVIIGDLTYDEGVLGDFRALLDAKGMGRDGVRLEDSAAGSVADVMDQIAAVDVVVASRFHNVLLALFLGKPVVSISYNEKNDALMAAVGLDRYCQWIDDFAVDRLQSHFLEVEQDGEAIRSTIATRAAAFRQQLDDQYRRLFAGLA